MDETLQAAKREQTPQRLDYRAGYSSRSPVTRIKNIGLRLPQDREGRFPTELFERYQPSEKALLEALGRMQVLA